MPHRARQPLRPDTFPSFLAAYGKFLITFFLPNEAGDFKIVIYI
jgi:hypothetical protein